MTTVQEIEGLNQINQEEFNNVAKIMLDSFLIREITKDFSILSKKEELIEIFSSLLEKYLEFEFVDSKESKLYLINFIDKLNMQKELLELSKGKTNIADIKLAAKRLGRKSQSAFKAKQ